jgi:hypothetical protein
MRRISMKRTWFRTRFRTKVRLSLALALLLLPTVASADEDAQWQKTAKRILAVLGDSDSDSDKRTKCITELALKDGSDDAIANDYYNIQNTAAGGLPEGVSFHDIVYGNPDKEIPGISLHYREYLGRDSLAELSDEELAKAIRHLDPNTFKVIDFLNGTVHQAGAGNFHRCLWNLILMNTHDSNTMYSCYSSAFKDDDASEPDWFKEHCVP